MTIRDAVETELPFRPEITDEQRAMLIEFAVKRKYGGKIRARGTDPEYPGSTFWELETMMRVVAWPEKKRPVGRALSEPGCGRCPDRALADRSARHPSAHVALGHPRFNRNRTGPSANSIPGRSVSKMHAGRIAVRIRDDGDAGGPCRMA